MAANTHRRAQVAKGKEAMPVEAAAEALMEDMMEVEAARAA